MCFILALNLEQECVSIYLASKTYSPFKVISIRRISQARSRSCIRRRGFFARFRVMGWKMSKECIFRLLGCQGWNGGGTTVSLWSPNLQKTSSFLRIKSNGEFSTIPEWSDSLIIHELFMLCELVELAGKACI